MTINEQEAEKYAQELVRLTVDLNQTKERIKSIKDALLEFIKIECLPEKTWVCDNGYVEFKMETKYKLVDIPATTEIDPQVIAIDTAKKAFETKVKLSTEGKKMLNEGDISILKLMDAEDKPKLKVIV